MNRQLNVAVIGLGSMGFGMATSILRAGHATFGFDVTPDRVAQFQAAGGGEGALMDIASDLDAVVLVVLKADQAEAVLYGDAGVAPRLKPGAVVIACPTVPPSFAREMERRLNAQGVHYLDAPISGGSQKAADGKLAIMASGTPKAFAAARPLLDAMAETVFELGDAAGAGSAMKAVNQLLGGRPYRHHGRGADLRDDPRGRSLKPSST